MLLPKQNKTKPYHKMLWTTEQHIWEIKSKTKPHQEKKNGAYQQKQKKNTNMETLDANFCFQKERGKNKYPKLIETK